MTRRRWAYEWEGNGVFVVREAAGRSATRLSAPADAYELLGRVLGQQDRELFVTVILDARNGVMGINTVSVGSVAAAIVHPREVFKPAILMGASSVVLAHCHPSGDPDPSQDDRELTRRLEKAGDLLGISVLDSLIFAGAERYSFKDHGLL